MRLQKLLWCSFLLCLEEDDLVQVWSMEDRRVVAWGEGHNLWVSGVALDSYWSPPTSEDESENAVYRYGSVGQVVFERVREEMLAEMDANAANYERNMRIVVQFTLKLNMNQC